jgi:hypothetical protein
MRFSPFVGTQRVAAIASSAVCRSVRKWVGGFGPSQSSA